MNKVKLSPQLKSTTVSPCISGTKMGSGWQEDDGIGARALFDRRTMSESDVWFYLWPAMLWSELVTIPSWQYLLSPQLYSAVFFAFCCECFDLLASLITIVKLAPQSTFVRCVCFKASTRHGALIFDDEERALDIKSEELLPANASFYFFWLKVP